jgi:hypothetical protein
LSACCYIYHPPSTTTTSLGCVIQPKALLAKVLGAIIRVNRISTPVVLHLELETRLIFLSFNVKLKYLLVSFV